MDTTTGISPSSVEALALRILGGCRGVVYRQYPHLDAALAGLVPECAKETEIVGTDGLRLFFSGQKVLADYAACPQRMHRRYLHLLLHGLYLHVIGAKQYEPRRWDLACDIAVERMIRQICKDQAEFCSPSEEKVRQVHQAMDVWLGSSVLSAEQIYARLDAEKLPYAPEQLLRIYAWDDHRPWRKAAVDGEGLRKKWERIRAHSGSWAGGVGGHNAGEEAGDGIDLLKPLHPGGRYDYHRFLRQFATLREEQELDLESFDPVQYQFGMEHYGNIPLIEPLEYREVHRLSELVIAIDTSGSCDVETVTQFLQETYAILSDQENFFRKMKVYLIQCDCCIEQVQVIHSREEWEKYSRSIAVHGRGGTDFTPVFRYVEELRRKKELSNLRAMIYFTDGDGIYPRIAPDYETAFVFVKRTEGMHQVPKWARVFCTADN